MSTGSKYMFLLALAVILAAILDISNCSRISAWYPLDIRYKVPKDVESSVKKLYQSVHGSAQKSVLANWLFVMEQSWNDSHPETHWKHETPLPGCDCITCVKLLTVVAAGNWTVWDISMTWSYILKPQFWGFGGRPPFWGVCFFDDRTHVTYCSHLVYSNEIQEINMSSNTYCS